MTLAGSPGRLAARSRWNIPSAMRVSGWTLASLALLTVAMGFLSTVTAGRMMAFFVAANIAHKAGWSLWAVRSGRIEGTKLLGMFVGILAIGWVIAAWFIEGGVTPYFWGALSVGTVVLVVSAFDATISPDEDRRIAFEPRTVSDVSDFEMSAHGDEHQTRLLRGPGNH